MDLAQLGAIVVAVAGVGGLIYTALRFQREDAGAVVGQMTEVLTGMRELHAETSKLLERCRSDRLAAEGLARENREKWEAAETALVEARGKIAELMKELENAPQD